MIKKKLKLLTLFLLILSSLFIGFIHVNLSNQYLELQQQQQAKSAVVHSRLNLLASTIQTYKNQDLSGFLQQVDSLNEVMYWELIDESNQTINNKHSGEPLGDAYHIYFHSKGSEQDLITFKYYLSPDLDKISIFVWQNILAVLLLLTAILAVLVGLFKWVMQLEVYANYLLSASDNNLSSQFKKDANPISNAINQLILRNSLLIKDKEELTQQIRRISYVDDVTELGNQSFFKAEFQVRLHNHEENESGLLMLLSFQYKRYEEKIIIDDDVLRSIATVLRNFTHDIPQALVARLREDDFAILLPNHTRDKTDKICHTLINHLDKAIFDKTPIKEHFVDIGLSVYKQGFNYSKVVAEADMALRNAQLQGGNSWYMYGEPLPANKVRGHLRWRSFLQNILEKRQLQLFGQKIEMFNEESVECFEVLVRIEDGKEVLTADTFLPMAHQCGLASNFDRQVVDGLIKQCLNEPEQDKSCHFSINLFISSVLDGEFMSWLANRLTRHPEIAKRFVFELKESHVTENKKLLREVMPLIVELGSGWCIEHFGSPDEDISYLDILPIYSVKIDRRVAFDIHKNKGQQLLLRSLLISLKSKKIRVYVEGVEKALDAEYLKQTDVDGAQGFYFCQPQRMENLEKFLKVV